MPLHPLERRRREFDLRKRVDPRDAMSRTSRGSCKRFLSGSLPGGSEPPPVARARPPLYIVVQMDRPREPKTMTMSEVRASFAKVLTRAGQGDSVEVTRDGRPVAVIVSVEEYRKSRGDARPSEAFRSFVQKLDKRALRGKDPWRNLRDHGRGRDFRW